MTTVYWTPLSNDIGGEWVHLGLQKPTAVLADFIPTRGTEFDGHYTKCPAFQDYYKNTFVVRSPFDIKLSFDHATGALKVHTHGPDFYSNNIMNRVGETGKGDPFLMSINLSYLYACEEECYLEVLPATLHDSEFVRNARVIQGTFDISKWLRHTDMGFEIKDKNVSVLSIRRNDPLFYVRFVPKNKSKVDLVYREQRDGDVELVRKFFSLKIAVKKQPFSVLYELAKRINLKPFFKKKCPFDWRK